MNGTDCSLAANHVPTAESRELSAPTHFETVLPRSNQAPFTKKARVAVAAGACACVVANHDKETFGAQSHA